MARSTRDKPLQDCLRMYRRSKRLRGIPACDQCDHVNYKEQKKEEEEEEEEEDETQGSEGTEDDEEEYDEDDEIKNFLANLSEPERMKIATQEEKFKDMTDPIPSLRYKIFLSSLPDKVQKVALEMVEHLDLDDTEICAKHQQWLNRLLDIPFGVYHSPRSNTPGLCLRDMKSRLDNVIYGNKKAKNKILEIVAQQLKNEKSSPQCIALLGPPGVGKTTLVREGIAKAIREEQDDFIHISLGGSCSMDSATLVGHGFTYEGACYGAIVDALKRSKCMNPIILLDEAV